MLHTHPYGLLGLMRAATHAVNVLTRHPRPDDPERPGDNTSIALFLAAMSRVPDGFDPGLKGPREYGLKRSTDKGLAWWHEWLAVELKAVEAELAYRQRLDRSRASQA
jgi:hypothetical protein